VYTAWLLQSQVKVTFELQTKVAAGGLSISRTDRYKPALYSIEYKGIREIANPDFFCFLGKIRCF